MYFKGWSNSKGINKCARVEAYAGVDAVSFPNDKSTGAIVKINFYSEDNVYRKLTLELSKDEARELISKLASGVRAIEEKEEKEAEEQRSAAF